MTNFTKLPRIIALCSPKSGGGTSALAVSLGRALGTKARRVLIVDFNHEGGALRYLVDFDASVSDFSSPTESTLKGVFVLCLARPIDDFEAWVQQWRDSSFDDIILDLPSASFEESCTAFFKADIPILLAMPEPTSLVFLVRWIRQAINRHMATFSGDTKIVQEIAGNSKSWEFFDIYSKLNPNQQIAFVKALSAFKCAFVLNHRRDNSEVLQSTALCHALGMLFGIDVAFLGAISYDERRWFYERQLGDVSLFAREDPIVREWMDIIRQKFDEPLSDPSHERLPLVQVQQSPRQFLRANTSVAARQAYRHLWEGYCRENGLVSVILKQDKIAQILTLLEAAWRRADFNEMAAISGQNLTGAHASGEMPAVSRCVSDAFAAVKRSDLSPSEPDAGNFLKKRRLEYQMSVMQLALKTRVPKKNIEDIENLHVEDYSPARLQAFLFEIAKVLDLSFDELKHKFGI